MTAGRIVSAVKKKPVKGKNAKRVRTLRLKLGMSQADLADKLGVALYTVFRWEKGIHAVPRSTLLLLEAWSKG